MLAKYFKSICVRPLYLIPSQNDAKSCGSINGLAFATLIALALLAYVFKLWQSQIKRSNEAILFKAIFSTIALVIVLLPYMGRHAYGVQWQGYEDERTEMKQQGLTDDQINQYLRAMSSTTETGPDTIISRLLPLYLLQAKNKDIK